jgi:hypothetical protein
LKKPFLQNTIKAKTFRLTGPTLETLSIVAYKQPITKSQVDDVRGVDSSHLIRGLMDKDLLTFTGKSELPGKPMLYKTTANNVNDGGAHGVDFGDDFHVYAVKWDPGAIIYYIDGIEYNRVNNGNIDTEELYVLLNLAMGRQTRSQ